MPDPAPVPSLIDERNGVLWMHYSFNGVCWHEVSVRRSVVEPGPVKFRLGIPPWQSSLTTVVRQARVWASPRRMECLRPTEAQRRDHENARNQFEHAAEEEAR